MRLRLKLKLELKLWLKLAGQSRAGGRSRSRSRRRRRSSRPTGRLERAPASLQLAPGIQQPPAQPRPTLRSTQLAKAHSNSAKTRSYKARRLPSHAAASA